MLKCNQWVVQWRGLFASFPFDLIEVERLSENSFKYQDFEYHKDPSDNGLYVAVIKVENYDFLGGSMRPFFFDTKKEAVEFIRKSALSELESARAKIIAQINNL